MKKWLLLMLTGLLLAGCTSQPAPTVDKVEKETVLKEEKNLEESELAKSGEKENVAGSETKEDENKSINTQGSTKQIPVELVKSIDGDTIKVLYEGKEVNVRYLLIDTPETSHPRLGKQPFGEEAKALNKKLVESGKVTLEFDVGERVDKYGRLLAYIYVDGKSVQKELLRQGLARVGYVYPPNTRYLDDFKDTEAVAKKQELNIWSVDGYVGEDGYQSKSESTEPVENKSTSADNTTTDFKNCTELREVHPNGVPDTHPAYQKKMDRDGDRYACEQ